MSTMAATRPAMAAAPTTRLAGSWRAVWVSTAAAMAKASTPLPASAQLSAISGASVLNPRAWVASRVRFQAMNPAVVASPASAHRPCWRVQRRVQGSPARISAAAPPARTAKTRMSRTANTAAPIRIGWLALGWLGWVGLAPGVQGVVDEAAALKQPLVVGLHRQAALADGQQPRAERVAVQIVGDVGGVDDAGQPHQGGVVAELEFVDEDLEGALVAAVGELRVGGVERARVFLLGGGEDLVGGDVADLGVGVDEPAHQPRAGDPVGLGTRTGDPVHGYSLRVSPTASRVPEMARRPLRLR